MVGQKTEEADDQLVLDLFYVLYVDDGAFAFEDREQLTIGAQEIFDNFARFGLIMHIGRGAKQSKTEAVYFPRRMGEEVPEELTRQVAVADGQITYCVKFKYLGSIIEPDLKDMIEVRTRIRKAQGQIGGLMNLFSNKHVPKDFKVLLYQAIPLNTVLWGCESWTLHKALLRELSAFHHKAIRKILGITMQEVRDRRIRNESVRKEFGGILNIADEVKQRQLKWLGKLAKNPPASVAKCLIGAHIKQARKIGRPQLNLRRSYIPALMELMPNLGKRAVAREWQLKAETPEWIGMVKEWHERKIRETTQVRPMTRAVARAMGGNVQMLAL